MRTGHKPDRTKIIKDTQALSYNLSQYCLSSESFTPVRPCNGGSQPVDHNFLGGQMTFHRDPLRLTIHQIFTLILISIAKLQL